jgi:hypothetical protein
MLELRLAWQGCLLSWRRRWRWRYMRDWVAWPALSARPNSFNAACLPACLPARLLQRALPGVAGQETLQHRTSSGVDAQPWELSFDELQIGEPIGEGSFGRVRLHGTG